MRAETGVEDVFNGTPPEQLEYCFVRPLAAPLDGAQRERLLRRRPVLGYLPNLALQENDRVLLCGVFNATVDYMVKLGLVFGDMRHLGLMAYAATCPEPEKYAKVFG